MHGWLVRCTVGYFTALVRAAHSRGSGSCGGGLGGRTVGCVEGDETVAAGGGSDGGFLAAATTPLPLPLSVLPGRDRAIPVRSKCAVNLANRKRGWSFGRGM